MNLFNFLRPTHRGSSIQVVATDIGQTQHQVTLLQRNQDSACAHSSLEKKNTSKNNSTGKAHFQDTFIAS